jgi:hypothetical protein
VIAPKILIMSARTGRIFGALRFRLGTCFTSFGASCSQSNRGSDSR